MEASRCSAEGKGGAFFIHSVDATSQIDLRPTLIDCSAELGGGMFLDVSHFQWLSLSHPGYVNLLSHYIAANMFSNCFAQKGAGIFFDGDWSDVGTVSFGSLSMSNGGPLVSGHDLFFSQSLSESFPDLELLLQNLTEQSWSMSTLASDDDPFKQVVVEGRPELSRNLDCPKIVLIASDSPTYQCISDKLSKSSSLHDYLPLLHLKDENNEYRQIPVFLQHTIFFDQTAVLTEQSIILTPETLTDPAQPSTLSLGSNHWKEDRFFLRIEKEGQVEISNVPLVWGINLGLCEVVDGSGTAKISSCSTTLSIAVSIPFISCSAGTLIINQSSITTIDPSPLTVPLIHSSPLSSFASNTATYQIRIEMDGVQFSNLNVDESLDGIVQLEGMHSLRLKNVFFVNVKSGATDAVRIVVVGSGLSKSIEPVLASGFPQPRTGLDALYKSLDISEPDTSTYRSATLLVYLSQYTAPTIHVKSIGKDVLGCGDSALSCFSLDEADRHLEEAFPSVISVHDSAQLASQLDITQDVTRIASGSGSQCSIEVGANGSMISHNTGSMDHKLELVGLSFVLSSGRSNALLQSTSGTLILTDCVIDGSSLIDAELTTPLFELKGGITNLASLTLQSITSSINLVTPTSGSDLSLIISKSTFSVLTRRVGSGVVFEGRMTSASTMSISESKFTECHSLNEDGSGLANGGAVAVTLRDSTSLEIRNTSFHSCSSSGNGGAIWIDASSSPAPFTFSLLGLVFGRGSESNKCGASKRGSDVFILGGNLRTLVDATKWEGALETAPRGTLFYNKPVPFNK
ncbi:hypothetical protein BLNAU_9613 [Blattamonas nauphoetae]|uniref:Uncharacterized protein n=1 Tax=Blattamonas nauphoetae TaxID=2049346 RepID=A0ABQ9XVA5_9EUKA|nr:hypothetical protein BLNAU_9613 [Blattamonas nauphoetae]